MNAARATLDTICTKIPNNVNLQYLFNSVETDTMSVAQLASLVPQHAPLALLFQLVLHALLDILLLVSVSKNVEMEDEMIMKSAMMIMKMMEMDALLNVLLKKVIYVIRLIQM